MRLQRKTVQKKLIREAAMASGSHPDADEIFEQLTKLNPGIGRATVYRNLRRMAEEGELLKVEVPNAADRFDRKTEPHYHFHCRECGKVFDMFIDYMETLNTEAGKSGEFEISGHNLVFSGRCPECKSK